MILHIFYLALRFDYYSYNMMWASSLLVTGLIMMNLFTGLLYISCGRIDYRVYTSAGKWYYTSHGESNTNIGLISPVTNVGQIHKFFWTSLNFIICIRLNVMINYQIKKKQLSYFRYLTSISYYYNFKVNLINY